MFSQKKSFFKGKIFYLILLGLFAFGYWINQSPTNPTKPDDVNADSKYPVGTEKKVETSDKNLDSYDIMDNIIGGSNYSTNSGIKTNDAAAENPEENSSAQVDQGYYLVKEVDGIIKIFYYDKDGKEKLIRSTDIAFSLLSTNDQALFQKGVIKHTADELEELLQDFES